MSQFVNENRDPSALERHEANREIYGEPDLTQDFVESVDEQGVKEPVVITDENIIISGHRRVAAAEQSEMDGIPVRVRQEAFESELEEKEAIVHYNKQRTKTFSQRMREAMVLHEIESKRANERQGQRTDIKQDFARSELGSTQKKVAETFDWSHETFRQAKKVWEAAQDHDEMREQVDLIDAGEQSIYGAKQAYDRWERRKNLEGNVDWDDARNAMAVDRIGRRQGTFKDSKEILSKGNDWDDLLQTLLDEHIDRWSDFDQGDVYVFAYLLESDGFANFAKDRTGEPDSFVEKKPDTHTLRELYWGSDDKEGMILEEIALRFGIDAELVKHWLFEDDVPLKKQELTETERQWVE